MSLHETTTTTNAPSCPPGYVEPLLTNNIRNTSSSTSTSTNSNSLLFNFMFTGNHEDNNDDSCGIDDNDDGIQAAALEMDDQVAKELTAMTPEQRNIVFDDVHGVSSLFPESPEFIAQKLNEFNNYIIKQQNNEQANIIMQHEYYSKQSMRMQFLRAAQFDITQATNILQKFINCKMDLFGSGSVCRDITIQQDFEPYPQDLECLQSGVIQLLPSRDQGGRFVMFIYAPMTGQFTLHALTKSYFFICFSAISQSVENQRRGMVTITYNVGDNPSTGSTLIQRIKRIAAARHCLPMRTVAHHMCVSDPTQKIYTQLVMLAIGYTNRVRFRAHYGGHEECKSALQAHGIPRQLLPIDKDGHVTQNNHVVWLENIIKKGRDQNQKQQQEHQQCHIDENLQGEYDANFKMSQTKKSAIEGIAAISKTMLPSSNSAETDGASNTTNDDKNNNNNKNNSIGGNNNDNNCIKKTNINNNSNGSTASHSEDVVLIDIPRYYDVLYGRGKMATEHPGNLRLRQLVEIYYERYEKGRKSEKVDIALEIINIVHQSSGRFLKKPHGKINRNQWVEVTEVEARDKVSSTFRNFRALQIRAAKQQQQEKDDKKEQQRQQHQERDGMESATKKAARRSSGNNDKNGASSINSSWQPS